MTKLVAIHACNMHVTQSDIHVASETAELCIVYMYNILVLIKYAVYVYTRV